jgi:hypothetical protein
MVTPAGKSSINVGLIVPQIKVGSKNSSFFRLKPQLEQLETGI